MDAKRERKRQLVKLSLAAGAGAAIIGGSIYLYKKTWGKKDEPAPATGSAAAPFEHTVSALRAGTTPEAFGQLNLEDARTAIAQSRKVYSDGFGGMSTMSTVGNFQTVGDDATPNAEYQTNSRDGILLSQFGQTMNPAIGTAASQQPVGQDLLPDSAGSRAAAAGNEHLQTALDAGKDAVKGVRAEFWRASDDMISTRAKSGFICYDPRGPPDAGFPEVPNMPFGRPTIAPSDTVGMAKNYNQRFVSQPWNGNIY